MDKTSSHWQARIGIVNATEKVEGKPLRKRKALLQRVVAWCALVLALGSWGCGPYSFSSAGGSGFKTVAVPLFEDRTSEFGIKEQMTDAIIAQFHRDNTLKTADRRTAESILTGTLLDVEDRAGAFSREENVQEIRVYVTVNVKYEDSKKHRTIWEEEMTQFGAYTPSGAGSNDRATALKDAIDKIALQVLNKTVAGW